mmetsp:Transcript_37385/g.75724  ORF Transcript_37385/g.75724 Transcript_37385/m.75724 type:complete len:131 (-) Transcript_37385:80-472(-)
MEHRLSCFKSELAEIKGYQHPPPLLRDLLEVIFVLLGHRPVLRSRGCEWAVLRRLLEPNPAKQESLVSQMASFDAARAGDELLLAGQLLCGVSRESAQHAGEVSSLLFAWASLQVQLRPLYRASLSASSI